MLIGMLSILAIVSSKEKEETQQPTETATIEVNTTDPAFEKNTDGN
jgi:hypothetical protein